MKTQVCMQADDTKDEGTTVLWNIITIYQLLKSVTSHNTCIFNNTPARTLGLIF